MFSGVIYPAIIIATLLLVIYLTSRFKWSPFYILIPASLIIGIVGGISTSNTLSAVRNGFGTTIGYYGIIIIAGTAITVIMEKTGAIRTIFNLILNIGGSKYSPEVLTAAGSVLSVSCPSESGFILFAPIAKHMEKVSGKRTGSISIMLAVGICLVHSLIPLSAGPVAAGGILNAGLLKIFFISIVSSIIGLTASSFWCKKFIPSAIDALIDLPEKNSKADENNPSIPASFLPLVLPVMLITIKSFSTMSFRPFGSGRIASLFEFLGDPSIALLIGFFVSLTLLKRKNFENMFSEWINESLNRSAVLIIIAGAAGAFGAVLKATPLIKMVSMHSVFSDAWLLVPFLISALIKTIGGSSTIAIITASSISAAFISSAGLDPAFTAAAVTAGSIMVSHANDPYFWIVSGYSGLSVRETYKYFTTATLIAGLTSFGAVWIMSVVF